MNRKYVFVAATAILVTACTVGGGSSRPSATPTPTDALAPSAPASGPIPLPDVPGGLTHSAGDPVRIGDATVVFQGLVQRDDGVFATFDVMDGSLTGAELYAGGTRYALTAAGSAVEAGPIDASGVDRDTELTVRSGNTLTVFTAGPLR